MDTLNTVLTLVLAVVVIIIAIKIISTPIRWIFKLLVNTLFGFVILFLINFFGQYVGISLEMNTFNAIITGVFGVPGVILLLLLKFLA